MSNNNDDNLFGLDDLYASDGEAGGHMKSAVGFLIRLLLAITTFGFFYQYAGNLFTWVAGAEYSPYLSAAVGAFAIDFMAYYWDSLRRNGSTTEAQMTAAKLMTIVNLGLSVLVTVVFFILGTTFIATTNIDGTMNTVGLVVNLLGLLIGIVALAGNGIAWAYFEAQDISAKEAIAHTQAVIAQFKGITKINQKRTQLQITATMAGIDEGIGALTSAAGASAASRYKDSLKAGIPVTETMAADGGKTAVLTSKPSGYTGRSEPIYGNIPPLTEAGDNCYMAKSDGAGGWIATNIVGTYDGVLDSIERQKSGAWVRIDHQGDYVGPVHFADAFQAHKSQQRTEPMARQIVNRNGSRTDLPDVMVDAKPFADETDGRPN